MGAAGRGGFTADSGGYDAFCAHDGGFGREFYSGGFDFGGVFAVVVGVERAGYGVALGGVCAAFVGVCGVGVFYCGDGGFGGGGGEAAGVGI